MEETNKPQTKSKDTRKIAIYALVALIVVGAIAGGLYLIIASKRIYVDKAQILAPSINLSAKTSGILEELLVQEGDTVKENQVVARVGNELIKAQTDGIIIKADANVGQSFNPGEPVVTMISPSDLRVIGQVDEDKGYKDLRVGQHAVFQVDAFGSTEFDGIVDEVSDTPNNSDVVFNISDKRTVKNYNVKIRFNLAQYSQLKNGLSAKIWIYK